MIFSAAAQIGNDSKSGAERCSGGVSYTHLDVYKRQAYLYQQCGETNQALDYLEAYVKTACEGGFDDPKLKGDGLFDHLEGYLDTFVLGSSAPRNASLIRRSIRDAVLQTPAFRCV